MDTHCIGKQTFDGLGRQRSVEVAGRATRYHYQAGQLPPTANTLADGHRLAFSYEPHLDNALLSTQAGDDAPERLAYHATLGVPTEANGALGTQRWTFSPSGQALLDTWSVDEHVHHTHWRHSLNGLLLGFKDARGQDHQRQHDAYGRIRQVLVGDVRTTLTYDPFSRPQAITVEDTDSGRQLVRHLTYDAMGREAGSRYVITGPDAQMTCTQTLAYSAFDQVSRRTWDDGEHQGEEHFEYDLRGRLVRYTANIHAAPLDPFGNAILDQRFTFNALDGHEQVVSHFDDGSQDIATYTYAEDDPTQVLSIGHTHASWPALIELAYDACGRLVADSLGRRLTWNAQDRLQRVEYQGRTCDYRYTPDGQLCDRILDGTLQRSFFSGGHLTHEQQGEDCLQVIGDGGQLFAQSTLAAGVRQTTLLGSDGQGSIRLEVAEAVQQRRYTAHGAACANDTSGTFGYAGERREPWTGWYIPAGYRPYDPLLMMFLAPDSESPFGRGGFNPYAYCGGDPVNRVDPDGHSWLSWTAIGVTAVLGAVSLAVTAPAVMTVLAGGLGALSLGNAMALSTAMLGTVSMLTGSGAAIAEASGANDKAVSVLGWISLGTGLASVATAMVPATVNLAARLLNTSGRAASRLAGFQPYKIGVDDTARRASVLFGKSKGASDVAFIPNLHGEGNAAFVTHGHPLGKLMNGQGVAEDAASIARTLIAPRLGEMGYPQGQKIVLVACWGGKSGAAQKIANELGRPVEAFSQKIFVKSAATLQTPRTHHPTWASGLTNQPVYKPSALARFLKLEHGRYPSFHDSNLNIATTKTYYPR